MERFIKLESALRTLCADCFWNDGRCKEPCRDYKRLAAIQEEKVEQIHYASWEIQDEKNLKCSCCGLMVNVTGQSAEEASRRDDLPRRCIQCGAHMVFELKKEDANATD